MLGHGGSSAGVRYNLHPRNMSTPRVKIWMRNIHPYHKMSTPGVIISYHEIFTRLHRGEYIMASNFHFFTWRQNIIVSNISPPPLGENFIVSHIYSSPGVRILYHKILTPSLGWEYYIIKYSLLYMGWQYYSIKYSPLLPDDDDEKYWMFICWLLIEWEKTTATTTTTTTTTTIPFVLL